MLVLFYLFISICFIKFTQWLLCITPVDDSKCTHKYSDLLIITAQRWLVTLDNIWMTLSCWQCTVIQLCSSLFWMVLDIPLFSSVWYSRCVFVTINKACQIIGEFQAQLHLKKYTKNLKLNQNFHPLDKWDTFFFSFPLPLHGKQCHLGAHTVLCMVIIHSIIPFSLSLSLQYILQYLYIIEKLSALPLCLCLQKSTRFNYDYLLGTPITCMPILCLYNFLQPFCVLRALLDLLSCKIQWPHILPCISVVTHMSYTSTSFFKSDLETESS